MIKNLFLIICAATMTFAVNAQPLVGVWSGQLQVSPQMSLKLVFHFNDDNSVSMDSPDQGAYGIPGETVYISPDSINMRIPRLMMSYSGHLVSGRIEGTFRQDGMSLPLNLISGDRKANRPQSPVPPFPYTTEDVTISHDNVTLAGTLTIPDNATKHTPVVVMVTGSGQQNRDEEIFEHKPFAVIADFLARNGIASLRYDDRGVGGSKGDVLTATTADFAQDAESVVRYLKNRKSFGKIGLLGHSEGGLIAYMLGAKPKLLNFVVSIAGPAVRGDSILVHQNLNNLAKAGIPEQKAHDFECALRQAFQLKIDNPDVALSEQTLTEIYPAWNNDDTTRQLAQGIRTLFTQQGPANSWMQYFMAYSPAHDLKNLKIPALIIYGEKDVQVPATLNAYVARQYAPKAVVKVYPYANHLMQHAATGQVEEYKTIEETISNEILADIVAFIKSV